MNRNRRSWLTPLALAGVFAWGAAQGAQPANPGNGSSKGNGHDNGRWSQVFQGSGSVTQTRCQGMSRGDNCVTAESRKAAARRAAAARATGQDASAESAPAKTGHGVKKQ